jgi:hypothetical protein
MITFPPRGSSTLVTYLAVTFHPVVQSPEQNEDVYGNVVVK